MTFVKTFLVVAAFLMIVPTRPGPQIPPDPVPIPPPQTPAVASVHAGVPNLAM